MIQRQNNTTGFICTYAFRTRIKISLLRKKYYFNIVSRNVPDRNLILRGVFNYTESVLKKPWA